jgi:hypothetical protein
MANPSGGNVVDESVRDAGSQKGYGGNRFGFQHRYDLNLVWIVTSFDESFKICLLLLWPS